MEIPLNIDWQQILMHLFNFCLLAGGLWLLLYKPVKNFMQQRTNYYKQIEQDAQDKLQEAKQHEQSYKEKLENADEEIEKLKAAAVKEASNTADSILSEAKTQKQKIIETAQKAAEAEKEKALQEANSQIEGMVSAAIDKLVTPAGTDDIEAFLNSAEKE